MLNLIGKPMENGVTMSEEEYLRMEQEASIRHEYVDGKAYAMSGASNRHELIAGNLFGEIWRHLKGRPCVVFKADTKVKITGNYFYPDVMVDCGKTLPSSYFAAKPVFIAEVLSPSTRRLDQTTKLLNYINIECLEEVVIVESDAKQVEVYRKADDWKPVKYFSGDEVTLNAMDLTLTVDDIYDKIDDLD